VLRTSGRKAGDVLTQDGDDRVEVTARKSVDEARDQGLPDVVEPCAAIRVTDLPGGERRPGALERRLIDVRRASAYAVPATLKSVLTKMWWRHRCRSCALHTSRRSTAAHGTALGGRWEIAVTRE
jgi:hypothetical protein